MPTTVVVSFRARPGRRDALVEWLRELHRELPAFPGFEAIAVYRDASDDSRVVEIEQWDEAASHARMVEAVDARGGWAALEALVDEEPSTSYLVPA